MSQKAGDTVSSLSDRRVDSYETLSSRQGDDVPICYGICKFSAPWGETVIGVVLEDLREVGAPIRVWARNYWRCFALNVASMT